MPVSTFVATIDSRMNGISKNTNYGNIYDVEVGVTYSGGVKGNLFNSIGNFNVSLPAGAKIIAAKLVHNVGNAGGTQVGAKVYRCTRPATWTELGVTWSVYDGTTGWTVEGGDKDATTPTPVAYNLPPGLGEQPQLFEITGLAAFVTDALANRSGIVSVISHLDDQNPGSNQFYRWKSRHPDFPEAERWRLVVDYERAFTKNININQAVNRASTY